MVVTGIPVRESGFSYIISQGFDACGSVAEPQTVIFELTAIADPQVKIRLVSLHNHPATHLGTEPKKANASTEPVGCCQIIRACWQHIIIAPNRTPLILMGLIGCFQPHKAAHPVVCIHQGHVLASMRWCPNTVTYGYFQNHKLPIDVMSDIISVKNLVLVYSDGTKAVDDISFSVKEGEFFGFLGPNGAGKSTTIKILTTLLRKTSGSVTVAGHDIQGGAAAIRKIIGVQSQETTVDGDLTGRENLMLQGHFQQIRGNKLDKRVKMLLELVGLEGAADKRARNYSGGMKKRLDLATALVHEPKLLFLDEPTTGLDPQSRLAIWSYLERLNKEEGITIFLTTQYLEEADRLCKRLEIVDFGKIVAAGSPAELKREIGADSIKLSIENCERDKPKAKEILKSLDGVSSVMDSGPDECLNVFAKNAGFLIADIVRAFDSSDIRLLSVNFSSPSLDDVFLKHTGRRIRTEDLVKAPKAKVGGRP